MRKIAVMLVIILYILTTNFTILASNLNSSFVYSNKLEYSVKIPDSWKNYVSTEFEKVYESSNIVEKLNFYFNPRNKVNKPLLFLSLYVFDKSKFVSANNLNYKIIKQNSNNVFAITRVETNPFTSPEDKVIFKRLTIETSNTSFLNNMLFIATDEKKQNTIIVNGAKLSKKVLMRGNSLLFLPIKDTCNYLGYSVYWNERLSSVIIYNKTSGYQREFYPNNPNLNGGYSVIIQNELSYVNSLYFIWELHANIEVDESNNAIITRY